MYSVTIINKNKRNIIKSQGQNNETNLWVIFMKKSKIPDPYEPFKKKKKKKKESDDHPVHEEYTEMGDYKE